jgi:imidazoleglycerol-phosphate dehydratase
MHMPVKRHAQVVRETRETKIKAVLILDGSGKSRCRIGLPFLEHMLTLWSAHGLFDLTLEATGDLDVDQHHVVEDIGITLGQALAKALGTKHGINRYGQAVVPMDESLVEAALDLSNRPYLAYGLKLRQRRLGEFDTELVVEFLRAFTQSAGLTLHIVQRSQGNTHHVVEAAFKALGRALRQAVTRDPRVLGVPSTKGKL